MGSAIETSLSNHLAHLVLASIIDQELAFACFPRCSLPGLLLSIGYSRLARPFKMLEGGVYPARLLARGRFFSVSRRVGVLGLIFEPATIRRDAPVELCMP